MFLGCSCFFFTYIKPATEGNFLMPSVVLFEFILSIFDCFLLKLDFGNQKVELICFKRFNHAFWRFTMLSLRQFQITLIFFSKINSLISDSLVFFYLLRYDLTSIYLLFQLTRQWFLPLQYKQFRFFSLFRHMKCLPLCLRSEIHWTWQGRA